jgi:hypothetical protein
MYANSRRVAGAVSITLADEARVRGLAFSGCTPDTTLIPDPVYLSTNGYAESRKHVLANRLDWAQRRSSAFWRGSTTGQRRDSIWELDRVRLCILSKQLEHRSLFDGGLSGLIQVTEEERQQVSAAGLPKEFFPPSV